MFPTPCFSSITLSIWPRRFVEQGSDFKRFAMEIGMLSNVFFEK